MFDWWPIREPIGIIAALLTIEGAILYGGELRYVRSLFKYVPSMFWIYFLPMVAATAGMLPPEQDAQGNVLTPLYGTITKYCLPGALVLLLLSVDLRAILRLGKVALAVMWAGSLGIFIGGPLMLLLAKPFVPEPMREELWKGIASLSASWVGGSANMITVAKGLETPPEIFSPIVVVDTIIPYAWMCLLIILSRFQGRFDIWNGASKTLTRDLQNQSAATSAQSPQPLTLKHIGAIVAVTVGGTFMCMELASQMPVIKNMINPRAWSLILATMLGLSLSFTPVRRLEIYGASRFGYAMLYLVLASIGATTSLKYLNAAPVLLAVGAIWLLIHAGFLLAVTRLLKAPMALAATASQANIGGPASAPVLAEAYMRGLAPVGLLLAVLGNIGGTYLGFICAAICKALSAVW